MTAIHGKPPIGEAETTHRPYGPFNPAQGLTIMTELPPGEYVYKDEIITIAFSDANWHYKRYNERYVQKMEKLDLPPWRGPPEKIRRRLTKALSGWHNPWNPYGFFTCQMDGKTYHGFKPRTVPIGDSDDVVVIGPNNRRVTNPSILTAIAAQMSFTFGDCVRVRAKLGDVTEEMVWRSTADQFRASVEKYHLVAPGATYEILEEFKFHF